VISSFCICNTYIESAPDYTAERMQFSSEKTGTMPIISTIFLTALTQYPSVTWKPDGWTDRHYFIVFKNSPSPWTMYFDL